MNELAIHLHVEPRGYAFSDNGPPELYFRVAIDGEYPAQFPIVVNPRFLVESIERNGEQFVFTCACGIEECANITSGVTVRHSGGAVYWHSPEPVAIEATFGFNSYVSAIHEGMDRARELLDREPETQGWTPPGYSRVMHG
jgi:hypothetical protein